LAGMATQAVGLTSPCLLNVDQVDYSLRTDYLGASEAVLISSSGKLSVR
jgi:hypothetical protein